MAVRTAQIIFVGTQTTSDASDVLGSYFIIDRIQNVTINPNITNETILEVGNTKSVGIIRDAPAALTFDIESYDVSAKLEALITNYSPITMAGLADQQIDFNNQVPLNILAPIRSSINLSTITGGVIIPHLALSQVQYRFGLKQDASQTFTFNGDSMFYGPPGSVPVEDVFVASGSPVVEVGSTTYDQSPYLNPNLGITQYAVNVTFYHNNGGVWSATRLFNTLDYVEVGGGNVTLSIEPTANPTNWPVSGDIVRIQYFAPNASDALSLPQSLNAADGVTVKPAAIRGWNIQVYWAIPAATPTWNWLSGTQSIDMTWQATGFEANDELGNALSMSYDYVVPAVNGTITTRADSVAIMMNQLASLLNVSSTYVVGMLSGRPVSLLIVLQCPNDVGTITPGTPIKTLYVPDAIFDPPELTARAGQKIDLPFRFFSNTGTMYVYSQVITGASAATLAGVLADSYPYVAG